MYRVVVIILLLAFLGYNVFYMMGDTTQHITDKTKEVTKKTVGRSVEGTKKVFSTTKDVLDDLEKDLEEEKKPISRNPHEETMYKPDFINSSIQGGRKAGYCYIGTGGDKQRVCLRVGVNDLCLSQKVYPTMDVCINPNLRP